MLAAGVALGSLVRLRGRHGVAIVAVGALCLFAFANGARLVNSFSSSFRTNDRLTPAQVEEQPVLAAAGTVNEQFLDWAQRKIADSHVPATFWLIPNTALSTPFTYQWSTYRLLPGRLTDDLHEANWIIFNGIDPAHSGYDLSAFGSPITFAPGFALAERRHVD